MAGRAPSSHDRITLGSLIADLRDFREFCGLPSYGDLEKVSRQLAALYGDARFDTALELKPATISAQLNRGRKTPPKRRWLVSFVLSCEWLGWKENAVTTDWATGRKRIGPPDPDTVLAPWLEALKAVQEPLSAAEPAAGGQVPRRQVKAIEVEATTPRDKAAAALAAPVPAGTRPAAPGPSRPAEEDLVMTWRDRSPTVPDLRPPPPALLEMAQDGTGGHRTPFPEPVPADGHSRLHQAPTRRGVSLAKPAGSGVSPRPAAPPPHAPSAPGASAGYGAAGPSPMSMSMSQERFERSYGPAALLLFNRAEAGDAEAAFRLGVLLCAHRSLSEGTFFITQAALGGNNDARLVLDIADRQALHRTALSLSYNLALAVSADGNTAAALMFCLPAAHYGHGEAAYFLATFYLAAGDRPKADEWMRRAARSGSPRAQWRIADTDSLGTWYSSGFPHPDPIGHTARILHHVHPPPASIDTQPIDVEALLADTYETPSTPARQNAQQAQ